MATYVTRPYPSTFLIWKSLDSHKITSLVTKLEATSQTLVTNLVTKLVYHTRHDTTRARGCGFSNHTPYPTTPAGFLTSHTTHKCAHFTPSKHAHFTPSRLLAARHGSSSVWWSWARIGRSGGAVHVGLHR